MPAGELVTRPVPVPALLTVRLYCGTQRVEMGSRAAGALPPVSVKVTDPLAQPYWLAGPSSWTWMVCVAPGARVKENGVIVAVVPPGVPIELTIQLVVTESGFRTVRVQVQLNT